MINEPTATLCVCEDCINKDLDEDMNLVAGLKPLGFWAVIKDGCPVWGNA
jgi:hypothetical protein